ncbi:GlsB/YeaQ/YmgE family stress response membrane protein [Cupriavidus necator]|uniref:GlsB/YeaQ/YmgE family stress response membrane protein n=1 Tax=Cupriavidus necator TaxID=106590 RepID=A0A1U9UWB9_CUPNE|nr:GlsB/YeaQ/YmgE family stress response membrane protein [Cupriavidus necator]AQV96531.1 GlsB/YeaQ/YmgE family stress response membrane protein [Cupriavidus necator]
MHLIWTILIGFVAGLVAKFLTPGRGPSGFFLTAALGIGGSLAATYLGQMLGWYHQGQSAGFIGAVVGAAILLVLYHLVTRPKA